MRGRIAGERRRRAASAYLLSLTRRVARHSRGADGASDRVLLPADRVDEDRVVFEAVESVVDDDAHGHRLARGDGEGRREPAARAAVEVELRAVGREGRSVVGG